MSARESGAPEWMKVDQYKALVLTEGPQTVLASTGNLIFLLAGKLQSVALVVVAYHLDENYSKSHIRAVVSIRSFLIHNPVHLEIMYNSLADSAAFRSISWTWMMSACLFIRAKRVSNCYMHEKKKLPVCVSVCPDVRLILVLVWKKCLGFSVWYQRAPGWFSVEKWSWF